ncbi:maleylpyruvate isomerase family mycothiol-dependent enzyme [Nakamurella leprariae]|uniref:Maleylpyruvate isomerase family mycothiol-dependent enzyme n=1 Tax=Nakamurella leprariae TaxID=2803911 RepID=A0A938YAW3_9ACTN|nr:maleylpyruvate isomerase family mycothiol-dependent enzyme [Nakamurella leprariae]MBM9466258.1 maleylpyruvate isomerase family mycothiol-dependent enzyme [Nakamurella leprariae]
MTELETIAAERSALVDRLSSLTDDDWQVPSLCRGWSVRDVLGHLVTPFVVSARTLLVTAARERGVDAAMDVLARRIAERDPDDLLALLRQHARSRFRPPGQPFGAPLTDAVVHSVDIRWSLGDVRADWGDPARLAPLLQYLTTRRARIAFLPGRRLAGLRLQASDQNWSSGTGAVVAGPSLSLAAAVLGRAPAFDDLTGAGVAVPRQRTGA